MRALLLIVAVLLAPCATSCKMTTAQRVSMAGESAYQLKQVAAPAWSGICKLKAEKCVKEGITASKDCKPWVTCQAALKKFYEAHLLVQRSVQQAAWWILQGDEGMAKKLIGSAITALGTATELARAEGALK